ncbi:MAG: N-acetylmuramoyl-L-alanine amidase [Bifidobacteriaceae bacterium]|jgi:hypothetical protein|nr:N-acetylmuramoyl-L-alanine amidase [Bifidobacteriaceae bacterium]
MVNIKKVCLLTIFLIICSFFTTTCSVNANQVFFDNGLISTTVQVENLQGYSTGGITWQYLDSNTAIDINYRVYKDNNWGIWQTAEVENSTDKTIEKLVNGQITKQGASEFIMFGTVSRIEAKIVSTKQIADLKINLENVDKLDNINADNDNKNTQLQTTGSFTQNNSGNLSTNKSDANKVGADKGDALEPKLCDRACWGANESWMKWQPNFINYKGVVIHHTAGSNDYTKSESAGIVRSIYSYHANTLGWGDIGYNFLVDKYGQIFEGRYPSRYHQVEGAHAYGANAYTFGISAMGNYETAVPSNELLESISAIINWKFNALGINPDGKAYIGTESQGVQYLSTILGHRDVGATACPGKNLYADMSRIKGDVDIDYTVDGGIGNKWYSLGGMSGRMGSPTSAELPDEKGVAQTFQGGNIYWRKTDEKTYAIWGTVKKRYSSLLGRASFLGYPTSDELLRSKGVAQTFDGGTIYWISKTNKTYIVKDAIKSKYNAANGTNGLLSFPKSDEMPDSHGVGQIFDNGKIFWTAEFGAYVTSGGIGNLYNSLGSRSGRLGYPKSDEIKTKSYIYQKFAGGEIRWTQAKGAWLV